MPVMPHPGRTAVTTNSRVHSALVVVDSRVRPTYRVRGDCLSGPIQTMLQPLRQAADSTTTTSGQLVSLASVEVISLNLSVSVFLTSADVVSLTVGSVVAR